MSEIDRSSIQRSDLIRAIVERLSQSRRGPEFLDHLRQALDLYQLELADKAGHPMTALDMGELLELGVYGYNAVTARYIERFQALR